MRLISILLLLSLKTILREKKNDVISTFSTYLTLKYQSSEKVCFVPAQFKKKKVFNIQLLLSLKTILRRKKSYVISSFSTYLALMFRKYTRVPTSKLKFLKIILVQNNFSCSVLIVRN